MLQDGYGNKLSTVSQSARDHYIDGVERFLSGATRRKDGVP